MPDLTGCTYENDSAASLACKRLAQTGEQTSLHLALPERESYREWAMRDGKAIAVRSVHRWGGTLSVDSWRAV
jgi:hypothetical protein